MATMTARESLQAVAERHRLPGLSERLALLPASTRAALVELEQELGSLEARPRGAASGAARHLLGAGGKRVRAIVGLLAAEACRPGLRPSALGEVAVAAELIHAASLLHDDVIDLGEWRRGRPAARLVYGNAASVLAGNLLLVEALERVSRSGIPGLVGETHALLRRMIDAEALQLACRGRLDVGTADYFSVVEGKTASVFAWSARAGARAVGAAPELVEALELYAQELGVVFQLVDDVLDLSAEPDALGKSVLQDLETGVLTHPLLHVARCAPEELTALLRGGGPSQAVGSALRALVERCGALAASRAEIARRTERARFALAAFRDGATCASLDTLAGRLAARCA